MLLLVLSPLVAEFLLGDFPITKVAFLLFVLPMYGCGAILIREIVRRTGRGWPTMLVLALAYAVLEEGITTMSLFNPNYAGDHLLAYGLIPAVGMSPVWTIYVLSLHVVWSIGTPIAMVEAVAGTRRTTPWLGKIGFSVVAAFFVVGVAVTTASSLYQYPFVASLPQLAGVVVVLVALILLAIFLPRLAGPRTVLAGSAPSPWLVGVVGTLAALAFQLVERYAQALLPAWGLTLVFVVLWVGFLVLVAFWSAKPGWNGRHVLALATGAILNYAWIGVERVATGDVIGPLKVTPADVVGQVLLVVAMVALIGWGVFQLRKAGDTALPAAALNPVTH
ncbi:hypothetical protein GCM10009765_28340 [Fodinicola feengrottensis]|uniref:DUF998 domain-containing protein n=1 Tax=Fodinicola feengrottensis TaxID=435914 RepID=A0ABN2GWK7_9ACTN